MPVKAIVTDVDLPADEPLRERLVPIQYFVPRLEPEQLLGLLRPKTFRIILGALPELFVFGQAFDVSTAGELRRRRKEALFFEHTGDVCGRVRHNVGSLREGRILLG